MNYFSRYKAALRWSLVFLIACSSIGCSQMPKEQSNHKTPNIIIVLADDLGWGDIEVYNASSKIPTPNINTLANQGMRFDDAHSPSAVCTPTRYGLLTGRYAWRSRLKRGVLYGEDPALIETDRLTIQSMLQKKGYFTAGIGKWHLGLGDKEKTDYSQPLRPGPISSGFDYYFGIPASLDMAPYLYFENEQVIEPASGFVDRSKLARYGGAGFWREGSIAPNFKHQEVLPTLENKVTSFIQQRSESKQPFFLYVPLPSPHTPWLPTESFRGKSQAGTYGDFVVQTDHFIGQIMSTLKQNKMDDNTLIIVTSDNGSHWKPEDIEEFDHLANAHWRGMKADVYEGGHRVPFVVRWPSNIPANSVSKHNLSLVDMLATVAQIVEMPLASDTAEDSIGQLQVMLQPEQSGPLRESAIYHSVSGMFAIQKGPWKYIQGQTSGGFGAKGQKRRLLKQDPNAPKGQLFHLKNDPSEQNNLYLSHPQVVKELKTLLEQQRKQGFSRPDIQAKGVSQ